jgi:Protein of unknown function (DUF2974)
VTVGTSPPQWMINDVTTAYGTSPQALADINTIAQDAQYAMLANAAYGGGEFVPSNWTPIPVDTSVFQSVLGAATQMSATVFRNTNGQIVVAFRGTATALNWAEDLLLAGVPVNDNPVMVAALLFAQSVKQQVQQQFGNSASNNIIFTGHSLGGAMAQYAAIELGGQAVTFNPAPLALSLLAGGISPNSGNITNFRGPSDPLTAATGFADVGNTITIKNTPSEPLHADPYGLAGMAKYNHDMSALALAMYEVAKAAPSILSSTASQ